MAYLYPEQTESLDHHRGTSGHPNLTPSSAFSSFAPRASHSQVMPATSKQPRTPSSAEPVPRTASQTHTCCVQSSLTASLQPSASGAPASPGASLGPACRRVSLPPLRPQRNPKCQSAAHSEGRFNSFYVRLSIRLRAGLP